MPRRDSSCLSRNCKYWKVNLKILDRRSLGDLSEPLTLRSVERKCDEEHQLLIVCERSADKMRACLSSEEDKPKDLFGKVLHYGPQFLGPIWQRVDAATAAAHQLLHSSKLSKFRSSQEALKSRSKRSLNSDNWRAEQPLLRIEKCFT